MLGAARSTNLMSVPAGHRILSAAQRVGPGRTEVKKVPPLPIYRQPAGRPLPGAQCLAALCETSLPPALSYLCRYDAYITVRTISLVQNVPRGTLVSYPGAA